MKKASSFTRSFLVWSILSLFVVLIPGISFALPAQISGANVIDQKPVDFQLISKSGKPHLAVVVFLSAKCPCSNSHLVELKSLAHDFPQVSFLGVHSNFDETAELSKNYFQKSALPFPVIQDVKDHYADEFHALKTPHAFVVDEKGQVLYRGGVSDSHDFAKAKRRYLREALNDLKAGCAVATPEGRTLGCVITREGGNAW
jgi:hypothetical protein